MAEGDRTPFLEQRFQQIMSKNIESMKLTDRRRWWSNRRKLDTQLKVREKTVG